MEPNALPADLRDEVHESLRDYVRTVIREDWAPSRPPVRSTWQARARSDAIESRIYSFEPETLGQQAVYMRVLATFDGFVEARRARNRCPRLSQLPPTVSGWSIWIGAIINAILIAFIDVKAFRLHVMMAALLALFVGLVIFLTADMDHPYAGSIAVGPRRLPTHPPGHRSLTDVVRARMRTRSMNGSAFLRGRDRLISPRL